MWLKIENGDEYFAVDFPEVEFSQDDFTHIMGPYEFENRPTTPTQIPADRYKELENG